MKTQVILVWVQRTNHRIEKGFYPYFGLGDIIHGTIYMYQLSKLLDFVLWVDMSRHPLRHYLNPTSHPFSAFVAAHQEIPYMTDAPTYIGQRKSKIMCLFSNKYGNPTLTPDCKEFIQKLLTPNPIFAQKLDLKPYNVLHFRLGDDALKSTQIQFRFSKMDPTASTFGELLYKIKKNANADTVLLSDNQAFKDFVAKKHGVRMFPTNIQHAGLSEDIGDTLFEFLLMTRAAAIKTYTVYTWVSGFAKIAHCVYDVPLQSM
jgi:hypothetical protein